MALTESQKNQNRKDRACGKTPRHVSTALTAAAGGTIDGTYGLADEGNEITNNSTRGGEIEVALQDADILA